MAKVSIEMKCEKCGKPQNKSEKQSNEVFNYTLVCIRDAVSKSGMYSIPGFGTFKIKQLPAKTGRNPKTQEEIKIPARKVVRFKASKNLL